MLFIAFYLMHKCAWLWIEYLPKMHTSGKGLLSFWMHYPTNLFLISFVEAKCMIPSLDALKPFKDKQLPVCPFCGYLFILSGSYCTTFDTHIIKKNFFRRLNCCMISTQMTNFLVLLSFTSPLS